MRFYTVLCCFVLFLWCVLWCVLWCISLVNIPFIDRNRRACIRCHIGWFSLTTLNTRLSEETLANLNGMNHKSLRKQAAMYAVDCDIISACEREEQSHSILIDKIMDLIKNYQRISNPNKLFARTVQVEALVTPSLLDLPNHQLKIGAGIADTPKRSPPVAVPPHGSQTRGGQGQWQGRWTRGSGRSATVSTAAPNPGPPRERPEKATNEGISGGVYPYHITGYGAFHQGMSDGCKSAHPKIRSQDIEAAMMKFQHEMIQMQIHNLDIEDEMAMGITLPVDGATDAVDSQADADADSVAAAAAGGGAGEDWRPSKRQNHKPTASAQANIMIVQRDVFIVTDVCVAFNRFKLIQVIGPTVPSLYRRVTPKKQKPYTEGSNQQQKHQQKHRFSVGRTAVGNKARLRKYKRRTIINSG